MLDRNQARYLFLDSFFFSELKIASTILLKVSDDGQTIINTEYCAMDTNKPDAQKFLIYFAFTVFFLLPGEDVSQVL